MESEPAFSSRLCADLWCFLLRPLRQQLSPGWVQRQQLAIEICRWGGAAGSEADTADPAASVQTSAVVARFQTYRGAMTAVIQIPDMNFRYRFQKFEIKSIPIKICHNFKNMIDNMFPICFHMSFSGSLIASRLQRFLWISHALWNSNWSQLQHRELFPEQQTATGNMWLSFFGVGTGNRWPWEWRVDFDWLTMVWHRNSPDEAFENKRETCFM